MTRFAHLITVLSITAGAAAAQVPVSHPAARDTLRDDRRFSFYDRGPYRPAVPRPEATLGYDVGAWHTQYAWQERVLLAIADGARDRVRVEEIGRTAEKRVMRAYIVSSPQNIARLDAIRADLDRIADPRGATQAELDAIVARTPAVLMFSGSVHGDEVPGFEASMQLLYQFAASEEPATLAMLQNAVIVINPSSNPDGHERFAVWYNSIAQGSPESGAMEQQGGQPWAIRGRFNHYRFDMNRDVFSQTQRETQAVVRTIHRWHPMVHTDMHGYTAQMYFAPPARPVNGNLPAQTTRWLDLIGQGNASAFDRNGWFYYVRDVFDLFYPGYYDTWPALTGASGMTYETDGGPALLKRRDDGTLLSLRDGISKHYVGAMAAVQTVASRARERVADYLAFRRDAIEAGRTGTMKRVVFLDGNDPVRAAELAAMLLRNGLEVRRTTAQYSATRAHSYATDTVTAKRFEAGAYIVDISQPLGRLAKTLLELDPALDTAFARAQLEKFKRNMERGADGVREGYEFYDVTAWSLPIAFGVEAYWTEDATAVAGELLRLPAEAPAFGEALPVAIRGGVIRGKPAGSAYLFKNDRQSASRLAAALLNEDFRVAIASDPLDVGGEQWPRGTFVVRVSRNTPALHDRIDALARESSVEVVGVNTAFPTTGQFSTGSESVTSLQSPKVAVVGGDGVDHGGFGAIWWTLDQRYRLPFTTISIDALAGGDLTRFNTIIIPPAAAGTLNSRLGRGGALRTWVQNGGTLIAMGGAAAWAARDSVNFTSARAVRAEEKKDDKPTPAAAAATDTMLGVISPSATIDNPVDLPGSFFDVVLDRTHWLTLGVDVSRMTALVTGETFFRPSKAGSNVAVFAPAGKLHRAGFIWPNNTERLLRGTSLVIEEPLGRGHVVLFANNPMFRAWWRSMDKMVLNAILLGSAY
ncbi:MAG TPA: M14 family zinc carboxypeptidase [Gemmatimonadaceae bacterium]|nr:M14 family zinc carboxypeptidase [Gemmatimonadaceae bacterium]